MLDSQPSLERHWPAVDTKGRRQWETCDLAPQRYDEKLHLLSQR